MSWINDLDALASAGVISFDAPAYIYGTTPRYYGNPALETISDQLPQIKYQPEKDEFQSEGIVTKNPAWKKWLFGGMVTAGTILGIVTLRKAKPLTKLANAFNFQNIKKIPEKIKTTLVNFYQKAKNYFSRKKS